MCRRGFGLDDFVSYRATIDTSISTAHHKSLGIAYRELNSRRLEGAKNVRHLLEGQDLNECNNGEAESFVTSPDEVLANQRLNRRSKLNYIKVPKNDSRYSVQSEQK